MSTKLKLIGEKELLETIWPNVKDRPSHRTLTAWRLSGRIPYVRIGGKDYRKGNRRGNSGQVWYNLDTVATAIAEKWTVQRKKAVSRLATKEIVT